MNEQRYTGTFYKFQIKTDMDTGSIIFSIWEVQQQGLYTAYELSAYRMLTSIDAIVSVARQLSLTDYADHAVFVVREDQDNNGELIEIAQILNGQDVITVHYAITPDMIIGSSERNDPLKTQCPFCGAYLYWKDYNQHMASGGDCKGDPSETNNTNTEGDQTVTQDDNTQETFQHSNEVGPAYQGSVNRETWVIKLWLGQDQDTYNTICALIESSESYGDAIDAVHDYIIDRNPLDSDNTDAAIDPLFSDLMNAALTRVNWASVVHAFDKTGKYSQES